MSKIQYVSLIKQITSVIYLKLKLVYTTQTIFRSQRSQFSQVQHIRIHTLIFVFCLFAFTVELFLFWDN